MRSRPRDPLPELVALIDEWNWGTRHVHGKPDDAEVRTVVEPPQDEPQIDNEYVVA